MQLESQPDSQAMWRILQYENPEDFVISTNETHSVREFIELAFKEVGLTIRLL